MLALEFTHTFFLRNEQVISGNNFLTEQVLHVFFALQMAFFHPDQVHVFEERIFCDNLAVAWQLVSFDTFDELSRILP